MTTTASILLLGATGYTGRLISQYLCGHPDRLAHGVSLTLAGRSLPKLTALLDSLPEKSNVALLHFPPDSDLASVLDLANTSLVINTIGPYYVYTPSLAHLCARTSTHYLDLCGEPHQIYSLIYKYDTHSVALSTRSLIIPSCGYDSIPSDFSAYLSAKALFESGLQPAKSTTIHSATGGVSGGTIATAFSAFSLPRSLLKLSTAPFAASPIVGPQPHPKPKFIYNLTVPRLKKYVGSFFPMSTTNISVVQRSYGLLELHHLCSKKSDAPNLHYGSKFTYDEFFQLPNSLLALIYSSTIFTFMSCLLFKPFRSLVKLVLPSQGSGPSTKSFQSGYFKATNITFAASEPSQPTTYAKTDFKGTGDPGYFLTSIMISECALSILVPSPTDSSPNSGGISNPTINPSLPVLAHSGGLLTPSTALGDVLIQRLVKTGRFSAETEIWEVDSNSESRKVR